MGSKFGLILSLPLIFLCFLYGVDFVMIQLTYTSLDAFSTTINYKISKTGEINDALKEYAASEINARLIAVNADTSYSEGSTLAYYLIKEYSPIAYQSESIEHLIYLIRRTNMSEIKGQLLGIILVVTIFGAVAGVLLTAFTTAANNTSTKIANDAEIVAKVKQFTPSYDDVMEF